MRGDDHWPRATPASDRHLTAANGNLEDFRFWGQAPLYASSMSGAEPAVGILSQTKLPTQVCTRLLTVPAALCLPDRDPTLASYGEVRRRRHARPAAPLRPMMIIDFPISCTYGVEGLADLRRGG
jgi:hypothetical protein